MALPANLRTNAMKKLFLILCLPIALVSVAFAEIAIPGNNFVPGWVKSEATQRFSTDSLYSYIDGGADLFLELGFTQLLVQRYVKGDEEIDLEIYQMATPEGALGIYLTRCGRERPVSGITARNTGDRSQFMIAKGECFLQVINLNGSDSLVPVMNALAQKTLSTILSGKPTALLDLLPKNNFVKGTERIIAGPLSLQPLIRFGSNDSLYLGGKVFGVAGEYHRSDSSAFAQVIVPYPQIKSAEAAFARLTANLDSKFRPLGGSEHSLHFRTSTGRSGQIELNDSILYMQVDLSGSRSSPSNKK